MDYDLFMSGNVLVRLLMFLFTILGMVGNWSLPLSAQIHGVPASATSLGPNGFTGGQSNLPIFIPAGATSLGPAGFTPNQGFHSRVRDFDGFDIQDGRRVPDRLGRHAQPFFVPLMYTPLYYLNSYIPDEEIRAAERYRAQSQSRGAQEPAKLEITIVDKRGDGSQSQIKAESPIKAEPKTSEQSEPPAEEIVAKVLVMRDGSKKEIRSYAILGKDLFDLADGRSRRIPLAQIDAEATAKLNEANGVDFKLP